VREDDAWTFDLVDDALDLPGWLLLPPELDPAQRQQWVSDAADDLEGLTTWEGDPVSRGELTELLEEGLELRDGSQSLVMFQIWPPLAKRTAICHINILASDGLPAWAELQDAVVQPVEAAHLGEGLQLVTQDTVTLEGVEGVSITGLHFIFDNGEVTVMLSLDETLTPLVSGNLASLVALMENVKVVNTRDNTIFVGVRPEGLLVEEPWDFEASS